MRKAKLLELLKIQPDEARLAGLVALFFGLVDLCRAIGDSTAETLFLRRFGAEYLPYMYIALGVLTFGASLGFAAGLGRFSKARFFSTFLLVMGGVLLVERAALFLVPQAMYPVIWLTINVTWSLMGAIVWATASSVCDARQAKRLFSLFVSASILGGLLGSLVIGPAAHVLGTENLILICALLLGLAALLIRQIGRSYFHEASQAQTQSTFISDIRAGFDYVKGSPLLQKLAVSAVLFSILFFSVSYPFNQAVAAAFKDDADMASFLGVFKGASSALMFAAALLIANRLYARIGIVSALLILPVTYFLGFVLFAANFTLTSAVIVRLAQFVVMSGIGDGAYSAFFNVAPSDRRAQVRAFDAGIPSQIGVILSGVLLILTGRVLNITAVFIMGMVVAILCAFVIWRMRPDYAQALLAALRSGRLEVFGQGERIFASLGNDADATHLLTQTLNDPRRTNQRLAAEMLGQIGALGAVPALIARLDPVQNSDIDSDLAVKTAVLNALARLRASQAAPVAAAQLTAKAPILRSAALSALPDLFDPDSDELVRLITPLLSDPDFHVRRQAALSLARAGQSPKAQQALLDMIKNEDETGQISLLQAFCDIWETNNPNQAALEVARYLSHRSPAVRRAACQGLTGATQIEILTALAASLSDPTASVRQAAAQTLKTAGERASGLVLAGLPFAPDPDTCLEALTSVEQSRIPELKAYAQNELRRLQNWKLLRKSLAEQNLTDEHGRRATHFTLRLLEDRARQSEQRLVKILGILSNPDAMRQVAEALQSANGETRSAAIEALDTLGDRQLGRAFLPLLEENPSEPPVTDLETILHRCLALDDRWLQAAAVFTARKYGLAGLSNNIANLMRHPDPLIAQAAQAAAQTSGDSMHETLPTLSLIERTILLREVPIFSQLAIDDLAQIAQAAQERWYEGGALVCKEGETGQEMFIIASGQVQVTRLTEGTETLLATRSSGDFIGEMAVIENIPRHADVRTITETRTLVFSLEMFQAILRDRPEVALAVMRELSRRLRQQS